MIIEGPYRHVVLGSRGLRHAHLVYVHCDQRYGWRRTFVSLEPKQGSTIRTKSLGGIQSLAPDTIEGSHIKSPRNDDQSVNCRKIILIRLSFNKVSVHPSGVVVLWEGVWISLG